MDHNQAFEDLAFIKKIIADSKQSIIYSSSFPMWGVVIVIGLLTTYFAYVYHSLIPAIPWIWIGAILVGWAFSIYEAVRRKKENRAKTIVDNITGSLWIAVGVSATIYGLIGLFGNVYHGVFISPIISAVIATGYFVTGSLYKTNWFRNLSLGWWGGSVIMFLWPGNYTLILMSVMMIGLQIIPSLIIRKQIAGAE